VHAQRRPLPKGTHFTYTAIKVIVVFTLKESGCYKIAALNATNMPLFRLLAAAACLLL
jgi:hypothetical protein